MARLVSLIILTGADVLVSTPVRSASGASKPFMRLPKILMPLAISSLITSGNIRRRSHTAVLPLVYDGRTLLGSAKDIIVSVKDNEDYLVPVMLVSCLDEDVELEGEVVQKQIDFLEDVDNITTAGRIILTNGNQMMYADWTGEEYDTEAALPTYEQMEKELFEMEKLVNEHNHHGCGCGCGDHHHEEEAEHECCGGHGHHEDGHECCGGHGHHHGEDHNCGCKH